MGISRQAFYKQRHCEARRREQACTVVRMVTQTRLRQPRIGTRKLHYVLRESLEQANIKVGRDGLFDILRSARLLVKTKRAYHKTTDSHHRFRKHPNLLKGGPERVVPTGAEQVWVADITYLASAGPFVYLRLVTDACSRKIVEYHVHDSLQTELGAACHGDGLACPKDPPTLSAPLGSRSPILFELLPGTAPTPWRDLLGAQQGRILCDFGSE